MTAVKISEKLVWTGLMLISLVYLLNPGAGIFEVIPDNIPIIGNMDEAVAVILLLKSLVELNLIDAKTVSKVLSLRA